MQTLAVLSSIFILPGIGLLLTRPITLGRGKFPVPVAASVVIAVVLFVVLVALPDSATVWARLHGTSRDRIIFGEDASGLSVLRLEPGGRQARTTVFVNGLGQSTLPYGEVHTALGMVPAFVHANPREVAIIGLGSGDTVYGAAGRPQIEKITCIEIVRPQLEGLKQLRGRHPYGGLLGLLEDRRIDHVSGDGRIYLMHSTRKFDIIEADALRPSSAYSGNLYSDAYFTLVRDRLRPKGLAATWSPSARVHNAFVRVFPYVVSLPGILLGSSDPIDLDREAVAQRLADPRVRDHYARAGIDAEQLMSFYLAGPGRYGPDFDRTALTDFNTDLFPRDEYDLETQR
jgi:predicted membrane-bound spermidine synthase